FQPGTKSAGALYQERLIVAVVRHGQIAVDCLIAGEGITGAKLRNLSRVQVHGDVAAGAAAEQSRSGCYARDSARARGRAPPRTAIPLQHLIGRTTLSEPQVERAAGPAAGQPATTRGGY